jgi:putative SOS response-associated peptidase YedK
MRWGFPPPPKVGNHPGTNVRNVSSPFWRAWLKPLYRCLVPLTSFSEYKDTKPRKTPVWFALNKDRPLAAFAGIWRPWTGCDIPNGLDLSLRINRWVMLSREASRQVRRFIRSDRTTSI